MGDSITAIVGLFVGAQLLVAGASKVSGFEAFVRRAGNQKFALVIVIIEILLASWSLVGLAAGPVLYIVLACFYLAGGAHCAFVVMSPTRTSCLCSRSSTATTWADVAANMVVVAALGATAITSASRPFWSQVLGALILGLFTLFWARAEVSRVRLRSGAFAR